MPSRAKRNAVALLSFAIAAATLSACTSSSHTTQHAEAAPRATNPTTVVTGVVAAGDPVAGATITLRAVSGSPIATAPSETEPSGAFAIEATDLPHDFRVVAKGGTVDGRALGGALAADVQGYDASHGLVAVDSATNAVVAYRNAHPGTSPGTAWSKVAATLGLPAGLDPSTDFRVPDALLDASGRVHAVAPASPNGFELDVAKWAFESLRDGANSYECRTNPTSDACKFAGFGDLLRMVGTEAQKMHQEVMDKLNQISGQIADLKATLLAAIDQSAYENLVNFMNPSAIEQAMLDFALVGRTCAGKPVPYPVNSFCDVELGDNSARYPGKLRDQIRDLINSGKVIDLPKKISGDAGTHTTGVLDAERLPSVFSSAVSKRHSFFNQTDSNELLGAVHYFTDLEVSMITLAANYWRWESRDTSDVSKQIDAYDVAVQGAKKPDGSRTGGQLARFAPLPKLAFDYRSALLWATPVACSSPSTTGPKGCAGTFDGSRVEPTADLPRLPYDNGPSYPDDFTSRGWAVTTGRDAGWRVPTENDVRQLLAGQTGGPGPWLKKEAGITFDARGEYDLWTANVSCASPRRETDWEGVFIEWDCLQWQRRFLNVDRNQWLDSTSNGCGGGPCSAWYLFERPTTADELITWGIVKRS